jgi:hypothetical protein
MRAARVLGRPLVLLLVVATVSCSRSAPPHTADELRAAIDDYRQAKPDASPERIDALFARFDAEIATLRADAAAETGDARDTLVRQIATLEQERRELQQEWIAARLARVGGTAGEALRGLGESIGRGLEDAGRRLRESVERGDAERPAE